MKRSQAAVIGFIVTVILIVVVLQLFSPQIRLLFGNKNDYNLVREDAEHISNVLIAEGFPPNWNAGTVKRVGLLDGDMISIEKLKEFANISYSRSKLLLGTKYDYMFFLENETNTSIAILNRTMITLYSSINRDFFGWNGYIKNYDGNGGYPFGFFYNQIYQKAKYIAKTERFVNLEDNFGGKTSAKLVIYTWDPIDLNLGMYECSDGIDNADPEDNLVDYWDDAWGNNVPSGRKDPGCTGLLDDNETDEQIGFGCEYRASCTPWQIPVIELSNPTFGQQHAALIGSGYPGVICCDKKDGLVNVNTSSSCEGDDIGKKDYIRLDSPNNAHIQEGQAFTAYQYRTCIKANASFPGNPKIECRFDSKLNCDNGKRTCVFSIDGNTNSHIGGCEDYGIPIYSNRFCCKFQ
jgi:hypothetical protein